MKSPYKLPERLMTSTAKIAVGVSLLKTNPPQGGFFMFTEKLIKFP